MGEESATLNNGTQRNETVTTGTLKPATLHPRTQNIESPKTMNTGESPLLLARTTKEGASIKPRTAKPRSTTKTTNRPRELNGASLKTGTQWMTVEEGCTIAHNPGTGSCLEVTSWAGVEGGEHIQLCGHVSALASLGLSPSLYDSAVVCPVGTPRNGGQDAGATVIEDMGRCYVSVRPPPHALHRLELWDLLLGHGWALAAATAVADGGTRYVWTRGKTSR